MAVNTQVNYCNQCKLELPDGAFVCSNEGCVLQTSNEHRFLGEMLDQRYKIERIIGRGSMGTVYGAVQNKLERHVAIKMLNSRLLNDDSIIKRFQREAVLLSRLNHPHIVSVLDVGIAPSFQPYIVMEHVAGATLSDMLKVRKHIPVKHALTIATQVAYAIAHAHRRGIVHRDLKPSNIVVVSLDQQLVFAKVLDFGIAKMLSTEDSGDNMASITLTGEIVGTPIYMSPEQCIGKETDSRSDIYSLGVIMFQMLCGKVPLMGANRIETMSKHIAEKPPTFSAIGTDYLPSRLESIVLRCLSKSPDDRYQTVEELIEDLHACMSECHRGNQAKPAISNPVPSSQRKNSVLVERQLALSEEEKNSVRRSVIAILALIVAGSVGILFEMMHLMQVNSSARVERGALLGHNLNSDTAAREFAPESSKAYAHRLSRPMSSLVQLMRLARRMDNGSN